MAMRNLFEPECLREPASGEAIANAQRQLALALPADYVQFLSLTNGYEGFIGNNAYVMFWRAEDLVPFRDVYQISQYAPGLFAIGSDGGGEAYGYEMRETLWPLVSVPFVGLDIGDAAPLAASLRNFWRDCMQNSDLRAARGVSTANRGKEIFFLRPIILGGDPGDPDNRVLLSRDEHIRQFDIGIG